MTNRVKVEILGSVYTITTGEDDSYVQSLAQEVNRAAETLQQNDPRLSVNDTLALVALVSADNYRKSEEAADNLRGQLTEYLEDASRARMELSDLRRQLEQAKREIERLNRHAAMEEKLGGGFRP